MGGREGFVSAREEKKKQNPTKDIFSAKSR
jgi:hypothetical protein